MNCKKKNKKQITKKMTRITVELKKEIVEKYEGGMRVRDLSAAYCMPRSTISTIVKNKEIIKQSNVAQGVKSISKQRSETLENVEKLLLLWITEKQCAGDSISESIICEKAKMLYADLVKSQGKTIKENEEFKASHGWFANFKKRTGIHVVVRNKKVASGSEVSCDQFSQKIMNSTWRNLCLQAVTERTLESVPFKVKDVFSLTRSGELDVCSNYLEKSMELKKELSVDELHGLRKIEHHKLDILPSHSEEEKVKEVPSSIIEEILSKWIDVKNFSKKYHPHKVQTWHNSIIWEDQTMSYFKSILRRRQKQSPLIRVIKAETNEEQQKTEREKTPECEVILQEYSFSIE